MTTPVRVGEEGTAPVPLVGDVRLAGLELEGAEQSIRAAAISSKEGLKISPEDACLLGSGHRIQSQLRSGARSSLARRRFVEKGQIALTPRTDH